ncbi:metalloregulator ArsR/SmtB family transcription factor [Thermaerobacter sp. PB12/4term]|uniref:ArsR/SmtB family transcription factor n=1 Tax=Thermaerobacter sp. PB12/4term TaxID=2293838 RepID=UPI000E325079|nr:DUF5937 family protein [Thermaerobacter sp. PB12/4term]QIA27566.1 metalloregulator ArsR/SmtB family transcription factor [Thermaerobacter sp. PB12/4term]
MTIEIQLRANAEKAVTFNLSPLLEAVCALEAVVNPRAHPLQLHWVLETRKRLPPSLLAEIRKLGFAYRDWQLGFFTPRPREGVPEFHEELADIERLPMETFVEECARAFTPWEAERDPTWDEVMRDGATQAMLLEHARRLDPRYVQACEELIRSPDRLRRRLVALLDQFWECAFKGEWAHIRPALLADAERRSRRLGESDVWTVLHEVAPDARVVRDRHLLIFHRLPEDVVVDVTPSRPLLLVPSLFTRVKTRVECDPPWQPCLVYAFEGPLLRPPAQPPVALQRMLFALAHEARLQILKLCQEGPKSTQELARALSLSEAAISRHVKILHDAGLVKARRDGYYVLYASRKDAVESVSRHLRSFLG